MEELIATEYWSGSESKAFQSVFTVQARSVHPVRTRMFEPNSKVMTNEQFTSDNPDTGVTFLKQFLFYAPYYVKI